MPVNIHGKEYLTVAERLAEFRKEHPDWCISTQIITNESDYIVMKATIANEDSRVIATGHAQEQYGSSNINKTSALENCETSAIGRCLASYGLAGSEFSSADELANAQLKQSNGESVSPKMASEKQKDYIRSLFVDLGGEIDDLPQYIIGEGYKPRELTSSDASALIKKLQEEGL